MVIVLTVVSLVAALVLALVNEVTTEPIRQQAINEINNGIKDVMSTPSLKVANTDTISVSNDGTVSKYVIHNTETANEISDLLYHITVLMAQQGITAEEINGILHERSMKTGNLKNFHQVDKNT